MHQLVLSSALQNSQTLRLEPQVLHFEWAIATRQWCSPCKALARIASRQTGFVQMEKNMWSVHADSRCLRKSDFHEKIRRIWKELKRMKLVLPGWTPLRRRCSWVRKVDQTADLQKSHVVQWGLRDLQNVWHQSRSWLSGYCKDLGNSENRLLTRFQFAWKTLRVHNVCTFEGVNSLVWLLTVLKFASNRAHDCLSKHWMFQASLAQPWRGAKELQ